MFVSPRIDEGDVPFRRPMIPSPASDARNAAHAKAGKEPFRRRLGFTRRPRLIVSAAASLTPRLYSATARAGGEAGHGRSNPQEPSFAGCRRQDIVLVPPRGRGADQ